MLWKEFLFDLLVCQSEAKTIYISHLTPVVSIRVQWNLQSDSNWMVGTWLKQILKTTLTWLVHSFSGLETLQSCEYIQFTHYRAGTSSLPLLSPILKVSAKSTIFTLNTVGLWCGQIWVQVTEASIKHWAWFVQTHYTQKNTEWH